MVADPLAAFEKVDVPCGLASVIDRFDDDGLQSLLRGAGALKSLADAVLTAGAGVAAKRSRRELGFAGLAARGGHRSTEAMLQSITGSSRGEAARQVRLGEAMGEADAVGRLGETEPESWPGDDEQITASGEVPPVTAPWYEPITRAVSDGVLTSEGAAAVMRGMGEPSEHCAVESLRSAAVDLLVHIAQRAADNPNAAHVIRTVLAIHERLQAEF